MIKSVLIASLVLVPALALADDAGKPSGKKHPMEEHFKKADKDHDGTLTKDEAKTMPHVAEHFDEIDTDKDGTVTLEEIHNYMKSRREAHQGPPKAY